MKRTLLILSTAVFVFSLGLLGNSGGYGLAPSWSQLIAGVLFYPVLGLAALLTFFGFVCLFEKDLRVAGLVSILLCSGMLINWAVLKKRDTEHNQELTGDSTLFIASVAFLEYHRLYPDRFHFTNADETVVADGFPAWIVEHYPYPTKSPVQLRFHDNQMVDPWNRPISFGLDRNHDGYIDFAGGHSSISGMEPPFQNGFDYDDAVGAGTIIHAQDRTYPSVSIKARGKRV